MTKIVSERTRPERTRPERTQALILFLNESFEIVSERTFWDCFKRTQTFWDCFRTNERDPNERNNTNRSKLWDCFRTNATRTNATQTNATPQTNVQSFENVQAKQTRFDTAQNVMIVLIWLNLNFNLQIPVATISAEGNEVGSRVSRK